MMQTAYIAIGSNISKEENIKKCINLLKKEFIVEKISQVYETKPVGYKNQENFYNLAVKVKTNFSPEHLFKKLIAIEKALKRKRRMRNGPRTIDLDILFYGDETIKSKSLIIPHPRMHKRLFVLKPLKDIAPGFRHPKIKKTVSQLYAALKGKRQRFKKVGLLLQ